MNSWLLYFRAPSSPSLDRVTGALADWLGAAPDVTASEWSGDPYNGFGQTLFLRGARPDGALALNTTFTRQHDCADDSAPVQLEQLGVSLEWRAQPLPQRLAERGSLAAALAPLGYAEVTWEHNSATIVDAIEAAGETALARAMRREVTAALCAIAPHYAHVSLCDARPDDLDAVLRSFTRAPAIGSVMLSNVGMTSVSRELARFARVESLWLHRDAITAQQLRGLRLPTLTSLSLEATRTERVDADDLAGLPSLQTLALRDTPLAHLDPSLLRACPRLSAVNVARTPLARDAAAMAALRAAWPTTHLATG